MKLIKTVILAGTIVTGLSTAQGGVNVGGTRLVYDAGTKEASLSVKSQENDPPYLIQSWVDHLDAADTSKVPFVITPPLFRLESGQENMLRVINTQADLPQDRESLYWLNIKSLAAIPKSESNRLQIAVRTRIKLFYRPGNLPGNASEAYKALTFSHQGNKLIVKNPTSYYVSFFELKIGGQVINEPGMVAPKGSLMLSVPDGVSGAVTWQAITDYGSPGEVARQ